MNTLGLILLGSIAHATGFAIVGILTYLALRRWGPAAGSLAAGSSLLIMVLVSMVVLGPWPRWWTFAPETLAAGAAGDPASGERLGMSPSAGDVTGTTTNATAPAPVDDSAIAPRTATAAKSNMLDDLIRELVRSLRRPAARGNPGRWGWPEWLATGFLVSLGLGLARLGLGLWGMARLRARSRPIVDRELSDAIEILRAELGCTRRIDVRESAALSTPATIGWRQPALLLPGEWRDWTPVECRAVLAHELAHVRRGDFLAGLLAQLGLALHFYHPLAHWLTARLRLEQELAADAWGARLSGGKTSYLATLAQMALRRDGRALTWPARAFLPSHGTFVRRIEMLRNSNPIGRVSLPVAARVLTVGTLAALGLVIAGLRGPAGGSTAMAQGQPIAVGGPAANESYNLAFLPADTKMVLVVRPGSIVGRREVQSLLNSIRRESSLKKVLFVPPEEVEQLLLFWEGTPQAPTQPGRSPLVPPPSGLILRMTKPQDRKVLWDQVFPGGHPQEVRHDGQTYARAGADGWGLYTPDDRTLVAAQEDLLRELIADRSAPAPHHTWDEAWKKVDKGQVVLALETRWLRRRIAQGMPGAPAASGQPSDAMLKLDTFSPLLEKSQSYGVGLIASDRGLSVDLVARVGSEPDAKPVGDTLQAVVTLGRNAVQGLRRELDRQPGLRGEGWEWLLQAADSLLEKARVETSEGFVHLRADSSVDLAEGIKLLVPAVTSARAAARRTMSVNNLKQIALAFHNYHSEHNGFPAAVNYGGKDKSIPYSWRVAILPFIEQQELYTQYNFDEPWDGPNNRKLIDKMPAIYSYPGSDGTPAGRTNSSYFVFTGPSTIGGSGAGTKIQEITDGTSNTILAVEAQRDIPWTKPEDIPFNPKAPLPGLGGFTPDGFNAAFADGSVRFIKDSTAPHILKALITRDGGEVVSADQY